MRQMDQEQRLDYIVDALKTDSVLYRDMEVRPGDRRRVMRSLMNIRMPKPLPAGFLEIQDEFLREEAREKEFWVWRIYRMYRNSMEAVFPLGTVYPYGRVILPACRWTPLSMRPIPGCWDALYPVTAALIMRFIPLRVWGCVKPAAGTWTKSAGRNRIMRSPLGGRF